MKDLKPLFADIRFDRRPIIISGPCSAESRGQVLETAAGLHSRGIDIFRAGVWKPRTKPGGFEGIGAPALKWLAAVRRDYGMFTMTEVATAAHLRQALAAGIDGIWIGARTSANPFAVQEIADEIANLEPERRDNLTVLVKNPVNPDLELWIGSLQRIYGAGVRRLGAIHRGFSAYGKNIYRNVPEWKIPIELRRRWPELPLLCDPSHIGGNASLILPLSRQALDMGFDGLFVETHCEPSSALSDAAQQITPEEFAQMLKSLATHSADDGAGCLEALRAQIDSVDDQLIELLAHRMSISREIGALKHRHHIRVVQQDRYKTLMEKRLEQGQCLDLAPEFLREILSTIHEESVRQQLPD